MIAKRLLKQYAVLGFTEGFIDMMGDQAEQDEKFIELWKEMKKSCGHAFDFLKKEAMIGKKGIKEVRRQMDVLKENHMPDGKFTGIFGMSFCVDLLVEQNHYTKGKKKALFNKVIDSTQKFIDYFDPDQTYEEADGLKMAEGYRRIAGR
jgi:hypothetical protein